jgi:catechol 2,3-dioxygenase-like lactoylglutathione lyase family enzyme
MITGVQDVYYNVRDMDRAVSFYRDVLGLALTETSAWWSALDAGGVRLGLHASGGAEVPPVPRDAHGAHAGATLTLRSTDLDADARRLAEHGVSILGRSDEVWGRLLVFEDPDGNVLKLLQPPPGAFVGEID